MLEALCYKYKEGLQGNLAAYMPDDQRTTCIAELTKTVEWIYSEGEQAPIEEIQKRLHDFKQVLDPVKARSLYHERIQDRFRTLDDWSKQMQQ